MQNEGDPQNPVSFSSCPDQKSDARFHSLFQQRLTGDSHVRLQKQVRLQIMSFRQELCHSVGVSSPPVRPAAHNAHCAVCPTGQRGPDASNQAGRCRTQRTNGPYSARTFYNSPPFEFATIATPKFESDGALRKEAALD